MLLKKKLEEGDIIALRLTSGEEVIGKLKEMSDTGQVVIGKPFILAVRPAPGPDGAMQAALSLEPFMFGLEDDGVVTMAISSIVTYVKARDEVRKAYIESTSNIVVPDTMIK